MFWLGLTLLLYFIISDIHTIYLALFGLVFYIYFNFFEISVSEDFIIVKNLFRKRKFKIEDFRKVEKTAFAPFVFRLILKEQTFLFASDISVVLKSFFKGADEVPKLTSLFTK